MAQDRSRAKFKGKYLLESFAKYMIGPYYYGGYVRISIILNIIYIAIMLYALDLL